MRQKGEFTYILTFIQLEEKQYKNNAILYISAYGDKQNNFTKSHKIAFQKENYTS